MSGATGLIGQPLAEALRADGHKVRTLSRSSGDYLWDPANGEMDDAVLEGVDAVIHLAGEGVAQRWTEEAKARIMNSRVDGTGLLVERILAAGIKPDFLCASGINYYGYNRDEDLDESATTGEGFLSEVCRRWEGAVQPLEQAGRRCVFVRTGIVLSKEGGALSKMLPPFKVGVGGKIGDGQQRMSWIALKDMVRVYQHCLENVDISGPLNAVSPQVVTNHVFTKTLGKVLSRPTFLPLPKAVIRTLFGEMGRETVLSDLSVQPGVLTNVGFTWEYPELESAFKHVLSK